ncbi:hypothetical protein [Pectobacterium carotovorum]|uniref:hypothetical protein n=1 Tax=Pectobacterium carotovorum TaxID=554 RepID=UPI0021C343D2|nr:hypothetical protein [Pectobacterium carotovorum]
MKTIMQNKLSIKASFVFLLTAKNAEPKGKTTIATIPPTNNDHTNIKPAPMMVLNMLAFGSTSEKIISKMM